MTQPWNKEHSEFDPNGSSRRHRRKHNHGERLQAKSWQERADGHDGSWTHQEERVERAGGLIETRTSWQDPRVPSKTSAEGSRPRRGNQTGHHAGARVQMLPWQGHPGPYDNTTDGTWSDYGDPRVHDFAVTAQKLSWQDYPGPFKYVPDRNLSQQRERIGQNCAVVEKTQLWPDHLRSSETVPNGMRSLQDIYAGQSVGAAVQPGSRDDHSWPNDKRSGKHVPKPRDQKERSNSAGLSLQTSPISFGDNFTQSCSSHEKSYETGASVRLPYHTWAQQAPDEDLRATPVALKKLLFFNPLWAPHPSAQVSAPEDSAPEDAAPEDAAPEDLAPEGSAPEDSAPEDLAPEHTAPEDSASEDTAPEDTAPEKTAPVLTHKIVKPSARHRTAHEIIQAHLGIKKCHRRAPNSRNEEKDAVLVVPGEHNRRMTKVVIPKRQCYKESKAGDLSPNKISPLKPVVSSFEYSQHDAVQEDWNTPTVCLPSKDRYGEKSLYCSGEVKANGSQEPDGL